MIGVRMGVKAHYSIFYMVKFMAIQSYKYKSKIATAVSFLAAFIVYIGRDELAKLLPTEWAYLTPIIILVAGYIATQGTENKRVNIAELLIEAKYNPTEDIDPTAEYENLNEEYVVGDTDDI